MPRHQTSKTPRTPRQPGSNTPYSKADWDQLCEITAHRILRGGFEIRYLEAMTSVQIGAELGTGVVLVVSAGAKSVQYVRHTDAGISEGIRDMAEDGMNGRMILYGLAFHFARANL